MMRFVLIKTFHRERNSVDNQTIDFPEDPFVHLLQIFKILLDFNQVNVDFFHSISHLIQNATQRLIYIHYNSEVGGEVALGSVVNAVTDGALDGLGIGNKVLSLELGVGVELGIMAGCRLLSSSTPSCFLLRIYIGYLCILLSLLLPASFTPALPFPSFGGIFWSDSQSNSLFSATTLTSFF